MRFIVSSVLALGLSSAAFADPCLPYVTPLFQGVNGAPAPSFITVKGTRLTARGNDGFTSHAAAPDFRQNMSQAEKASRDRFTIAKNAAGSAIEGPFLDVFPGRPDGAIDATTLKISPNGRVEIILNRWNNTVVRLANVNCYPGHQNKAFILNGRVSDPGFGTDMWTFVLSPYFVN